jgi:hypothetical protein
MPHGWSAKSESSVEAPEEGAIKTHQEVALVSATQNKRRASAVSGQKRAPKSARITTSNPLPLA